MAELDKAIRAIEERVNPYRLLRVNEGPK
jgi:hypothetical protein